MVYPIEQPMIDRLQNTFTYHPPTGPDQVERYGRIRQACHGLATMLVTMTPPSCEQSVMLTKLEEAVFWANAAIARNEGMKNA